MDDKMDSEHSYSGDSSTSTESSSGSSEGDEEVMEPVHLLGLTLELPQQLCEDYTLFKEFFSMKTWESLEDNHKEQLKKLLPNFTENEEEETETTIKMLFSHEPFHFTSPLSNFFNNLRQGNYRPDIAKMRKFLMKARAKQQRHKIKSYYAKLLPEVLISRERLLAAIKSAPPGPAPKLPGLPLTLSEKNTYTRPIYMRVRQRYFEELTAIRSEMGGDESDDDNYPEGPPDQFIRKKKQGSSSQKVDNNISGTLGAMDPTHPTSLECLKNVLAAHRSRRQYRENHPELNTTGISIDDIKQRVSLVNGAKKLMFGGSKADLPNQKIRKGPKKDASGKQVNKAKKAKEDPQDSIEGLMPNIKIKCEPEESDSESSSLLDPVTSPMSGKKPMEHVEIKQEVVDKCLPTVTNALFNDPKLDCVIKQEPEDTPPPATNASKTKQPVPIRLEELDGIDMMALPVEIADEAGEVAGGSAEAALTQTTHACFLSLVRALFPATAAHRASKKQLRARCAAALASPIAPLNTWYTQSDDWCAELDSALDFLAGERGPHPDEFVPYLQFIPETQMYQWIGAGRDCDAILGRLCERWLRTASPPPNTAEAPPPKYPTSWVVRAPTNSEIADFRAQERKRFASAAKPFTYVQHGYRAAVGPCLRGGVGAASSALLVAARPRHATFAALLRDALARLPNGEGTRHDVLTLLKMSQWVGQCSDQALLVALSSALDRLHAAKRDPLVKYDQRTAVWTYMHRHRSEEDWAKLCGARRGPKPRPPPPSPPRMEVDPCPADEPPEASDSDVDVEETGAAPTSALLLRGPPTPTPTVPTPPTPAPPPPAKQKGKRVATPTPKPKPAPKQPQPKQTPPKQTPPKPPTKANAAKQPALMSHSVKQASLMAQSVKQATLMSQAAKQNLTHLKQTLVPTPKTSQPSPKAAAQPKQTNATTKQTTPKATVQAKVVGAAKQVQSPVINVVPSASTSQVKTSIVQTLPVPVVKSMPSVVVPPQKSPLIKQRPLQKTEVAPPPHSQGCISSISQQIVPTPTVVQTPTAVSIQNKVAQVTRSLLIRPPAVHTVQTTAAPLVSTTIQSQVTPTSRRGVVRVLSPATPSSGKSLISPRALMQQNTPTTKKRAAVTSTVAVPFPAQSTGSVTTVVSSTGTGVAGTRTVQLGGRTVQLANQTVHLPGGQAVQLTAGHTLQLSSLQLPTHSVRLPSGQTVQLASPQTVRVSTTAVKNPSPRTHQSSPTIKNVQTSSTVQIPVSTMQIAGQTVQIAGQTVQLAGQSVQLTGHTVKLPSGQSVQVASQSVLPSQSVQLPTGQTVQLGGNVQTIQLGGANVQIPSGQSVHLGGQTVQLGGQTVQLAGGQTVQLPGGQTLQLSSGQTVQLPSGQTLQLAGQTMQLSNQTPKSLAQVIRAQATGDKSAVQPIVAKLLTNAQGQMVSVEGRAGTAGAVRAVRVLPPTTRLARPLLLTSGKPLHNIILQQSDGSIRVTSSGMAGSTQTLVLGNIGAQANTSTTSAPVLKLQQVNQIQQVKLAQGIKIQQQTVSTAGATTTGVRSVVMDGQQLKLVGGRHVLARILRPAHPQ